MFGSVREESTNSKEKFYYGLLHMDTPLLADQQKLLYFSMMEKLDAVLRTYKVCWPVG